MWLRDHRPTSAGPPTPLGIGDPAPFEGRVGNADGDEVGGLLLLMRHGLLESLEVYSYEPLPLPLLAHVDFAAR